MFRVDELDIPFFKHQCMAINMIDQRKIVFGYPNPQDAHGLHKDVAEYRAKEARRIGLPASTIETQSQDFLECLCNADPDAIFFLGRSGYDARATTGNVQLSFFKKLKTSPIATLADHPYSRFMIPLLHNTEPDVRFVLTYGMDEELRFFFPKFQNNKPIPWQLLYTARPISIPARLKRTKDREIDLLAPLGLEKFINRPSLDAILNGYPSDYRDVGRIYYEYASDNATKSTVDIIRDVSQSLASSYFDFAKMDLQKKYRIMQLIGDIDWRIRYNRRVSVLRSLSHLSKSTRIVITASPKLQDIIFPEKKPENVTFIGQVPNRKLQNLYSSSKVVLNVNPTYTDLISERVTDAMSNGCAVISSYQAGIQSVFDLNQEIITYSDDGESIREIFPDENRRTEEIALNAQNRLISIRGEHSFSSLLECAVAE